MNNTIKFLIASIVGGIIVLLGVLLIPLNKSHGKTVYILPEKIFQEFEPTKKMSEKLNDIGVQQKRVLDSLMVEITMDQRSSNRKQLEQGLNKKIYYEKLKSQYIQSNQQLEGQYKEELWKQINQFITDLGKENNYQYILGATGDGNIMFADTSNNITDEVIIYINKKYRGE